MGTKPRLRATSVRALPELPKFGEEVGKGNRPTANVQTNDAVMMEPCACGCGKKINVRAPWGRFSINGVDHGVFGADCNARYLKQRADALFSHTVH